MGNLLPYVPGATQVFYGKEQFGTTPLTTGDLLLNGFNELRLTGAPAFRVCTTLSFNTTSVLSDTASGLSFAVGVMKIVPEHFPLLLGVAVTNTFFLYQTPTSLDVPLSSGYATSSVTLPAGDYTLNFQRAYPDAELLPDRVIFAASLVVTPMYAKLARGPCVSQLCVASGAQLQGQNFDLVGNVTYVLSRVDAYNSISTDPVLPGWLIQPRAPRTMLVVDAVCNCTASLSNTAISTCDLQLAFSPSNALPTAYDAQAALNATVASNAACGLVTVTTAEGYIVATATTTVQGSDTLTAFETLVSYRALPLLDGYPMPVATTWRWRTAYTITADDAIAAVGAPTRKLIVSMPGSAPVSASALPTFANVSWTLDGAPSFVVTLDVFCNVRETTGDVSGYIMGDCALYNSTQLRTLTEPDTRAGNAFVASRGSFTMTTTTTAAAGTYYPVVDQYVLSTASLTAGQVVTADWFVRAIAVPMA